MNICEQLETYFHMLGLWSTISTGLKASDPTPLVVKP